MRRWRQFGSCWTHPTTVSFSDEDWDHTLGGMHAMVWDGDDLVGHGSVVRRQFLHLPRGRDDWHSASRLRTGYVEGVAVRAENRRRGIGKALMAGLGDVIRRAYPLGVLSASDEGRSLYEALGWQAWHGPTFVQSPSGIERTPSEDGGILLLSTMALDLDGSLACDWRSGDVW
jgi:aminoglycoside 2'-N-acetyltransferase I